MRYKTLPYFFMYFVFILVAIVAVNHLPPLYAQEDNFNLGGEQNYPAFLDAQKVAVLSSEINGVVKQVVREPQDFVKQQEVILQLDDELIRLEIQSIEAKIEMNTSEEKARISLDFTEDNLKIKEQLFNTIVGGSRVGSPIEFKEATQRRDIAALGDKEARLEMALLKLSLQHNHSMLRKHQVRAPMDGVVVSLSSVESLKDRMLKRVEVGETVQAGIPVAAMLKVDKLRVTHQLPVEEINAVSLGQTARVYVQGGPEQGEPAQVVYISPTVDTVGQFNIEVEFTNPPGSVSNSPKGAYRYRYRPGMRGRVEIVPDS